MYFLFYETILLVSALDLSLKMKKLSTTANIPKCTYF